MEIIDCQIHIWKSSTEERPWPASGEQGRAKSPHQSVPFGIDELIVIMERAGVSGAVLVPPSWEGDYNDYVLEAAERFPQKFCVMGRLDSEQVDAKDLIENWRTHLARVGLRYVFTPQSPWHADGSDYWIWRAAERAGVPISLAPHGHFKMIGDIAEKHPNLQLSIDHMGTDVTKRDADAFAWLPQMLDLARFRNVGVKVSGLPCISTRPYPFTNVHDYLWQVFDTYGPSRMFWGADLTRMSHPYEQAVTMFSQELPWLRGAELELVMGRALREWLGWFPSKDIPYDKSGMRRKPSS